MATCEIETGLALLSRVGPHQNISKLCPYLSPETLEASDVIEILGVSGSGKSIVAYDMLMRSLLPDSLGDITIGGLNMGAIYIDNDDHFNILHFHNMMKRKLNFLFQQAKMNNHSTLSVLNKEEVKKEIETTLNIALKKLTVIRCASSNEFKIALLTIDKVILQKPDVCVIIVDSLSSFYWYDRAYHFQNWGSMESHYNKVIGRFLQITKNSCILTVGVTMDLFNQFKKRSDTFFDKYEYLGKEWQNRVTVRIVTKIISCPNKRNQCRLVATTKKGEKNVLFDIHEDGLRLL